MWINFKRTDSWCSFLAPLAPSAHHRCHWLSNCAVTCCIYFSYKVLTSSLLTLTYKQARFGGALGHPHHGPLLFILSCLQITLDLESSRTDVSSDQIYGAKSATQRTWPFFEHNLFFWHVLSKWIQLDTKQSPFAGNFTAADVSHLQEMNGIEDSDWMHILVRPPAALHLQPQLNTAKSVLAREQRCTVILQFSLNKELSLSSGAEAREQMM